MFIPRAKNENLTGKQKKISFPAKIFSADKPSRDLVSVLREFMPYSEFSAVEKRSDADFIFEVRPGISQRSEYYEIHSSETCFTATAKDRRGLINAAATLAQMINLRDGEFFLMLGDICDWPDKPFRAFMADTGRKYVPLDEFRAHILMMAKAKMNKFHWHISDGKGYPIALDSYPNLKSPDPDGRKYSKAEVRALVEYAELFGIDVIPEIDLPGHADALTESLPELKCTTEGKANGWCVCLGTEATFDYIKTLFTELTELFPYEYMHIGGDEIAMRDITTEHRFRIPDWDDCDRCKRRFRELGLVGDTERFYYFLRRVYSIVTSLGKKVIMWNDDIDISVSPEIPRDILIMFWRVAGENRGPREGCSMRRFLEEGFEVINADYPNTYIDLPEYVNWHDLKNWNLDDTPGKAGELSHLVLGGVTCAWDVFKHFAHSLYTVVPAFADRVYNLAPVTDEESFMRALTRFALGVSCPEGENMFGKYIKDIVLTTNDYDIFSKGCNKVEFKKLLTSLTNLCPSEELLVKAYVSYI